MKHSVILDDKGRLAKDVYDRWNPTQNNWVANRLDTYRYNEDGIKMEEETKYWDQTTNSYNNHLKTVYFYSIISIAKPINPESPNGDFYLYPNPATSYVYISNLYEESLLTIYSLDGKALYQKKIVSVNEPVNVSSLKKGVYVVTLKSESGVRTTKLVKE